MNTVKKLGLGVAVLAVLGIGVDRLAAAPRPAGTGESAARAEGVHSRIGGDARAARIPFEPAKVESLRSKRDRIRERREQRMAARVVVAGADGPEAIVTDSCDDGCMGTLAMQIALAKALSGCRDDLPEAAQGKSKFRVHVIAEPGIGAVVERVEVLQNEVNDDFAECIVQSAPLAELSDPEHPIADDFVFRYTIGKPANPAGEFITAHPDLVRARPDLAALVARGLDEMTGEEATAFARWIDEDRAAQAAFGTWAAEAGIDLANVRVD